MSRLDELLARGLERLFGYAARRVAYRRGSRVAYLEAVPGTSLLKVADDYGRMKLVRTDRDWLIRVRDLVLGGERTEPRRGDRIVDEEGNQFEVQPVEGEPEWRFSTPEVYRVHTILVEHGATATG